MFLIHGVCNFRPRRVAFRRDYCRTCQAQWLAVLDVPRVRVRREPLVVTLPNR